MPLKCKLMNFDAITDVLLTSKVPKSPLQEEFAENTNKSFHVCKVIVVLLIYHKMFGIK